MARRTLADFIRQGFHARDKATCDQIIRDAEEAAEEENGHDEPDGDEGAVHVHVHRDQQAQDQRLTKLEDAVSSIAKQVTRLGDTISKIKDDIPEAFKKHQFGKQDGENGDEDDDKTEDAVEGGAPSPDKELGAQSAEALTSAEPDLMGADPSLKTGKSMMGDAAYVEKVKVAVGKLFQDTAARAKVLSPNLKMPTMDAGARGQTTQDALCNFRRASLTQALTTELGAIAVGKGHTSDTIKGLSCEAARTLFKDASEKMREINNARGYVVNPAALQTTDLRTYRSAMSQRVAGINQANREFWAKQTGRSVH